MSGQIVDASLVPAPKQRNTDDERDAIKAGQSADEIWPNEPAKAAQKDTDARWTLKIGGKERYRPDGTPLPMIAIPVYIDRRYGFIRAAAVTSASPSRWPHAAPGHRPGEHRQRGLGRQRLPITEQ